MEFKAKTLSPQVKDKSKPWFYYKTTKTKKT